MVSLWYDSWCYCASLEHIINNKMVSKAKVHVTTITYLYVIYLYFTDSIFLDPTSIMFVWLIKGITLIIAIIYISIYTSS